jgi:wobble nucleotide-excising tRNase
MISKIIIDKIASFKKQTSIETDKKMNIIYGLNGTGKTTISDFLYYRNEPKFSNCSVKVPDNELLLVYNTSFIQEHFYKKPNQDGIFTLSKENKTAEENIKKANEEITRLEKEKKQKAEIRDSLLLKETQQKEQAAEKTWEIKTKYTGGDRVLEYCLDRLKANKNTLFDYICQLNRPETLLSKTIDELKKEITLLNDNTGTKYDLLPKMLTGFSKIEKDGVFGKVIIGNENSVFASLIKQLDNADWLKSGIKYLPDEGATDKNKVKCPFCQQETITKEVIANIKSYFNDEYEEKINYIKELLSEYTKLSLNIRKEKYDGNHFIDEVKSEFDKLINSAINCINKNTRKIQDKITSPSQEYILDDSSPIITEFNIFIDEVNKKIEEHNLKIDNKQQSLNDIKIIFWQIMRYNYDLIISEFCTKNIEIQEKINTTNTELQAIESEIEKQLQIVKTEQRKTINIDEAIENINNNLLLLGIDGFTIIKYDDNFYKIIRDNQNDDIFTTLSEGEKMIISFLYFIELCKGKKEITETASKKIVIIDDPISSLSHIFIFNIGELIKREFFNSTQFEQVFILTHSLYFFYEMTDINHDRREKTQKLFRIIKNTQGSSISEMKYEEIQNDYQSYWSIINNPDYPSAIHANCMRNIVEYFFGFIEKKDLNNLFQNNKKMQDIKYQAFYRYINRESHSIGQNIFDYKEFDYDIFKEALKTLFYECEYKEHYDKMSKIR